MGVSPLEYMKIMLETRIALIDNALDHSIYNPVRHWQICLQQDFEIFRAPENRFPAIADFTHIILSGSEASVMEREKWARHEIDLAKEAYEKGLSLLGSCYGHQILAVALASPQHVRRAARPEIGWIQIDIDGDDGYLGPEHRAFCFSSHLDEVINLPDEFLVLASSSHCKIQAFRHRDRPVLGLQIHPEMNIDEAQWYLEKRVQNKHEPLPLFQKALDSTPRDSGLIHHVMRAFLSSE
jgi:GMP synthase-like glutamine amidotransferase